MSRLIVVSNRLPAMRSPGVKGEPKIPAGGLASAVFAALRNRPGSVWFGWNGRTAEGGREKQLTRSVAEGVELVGVPLTRAELDDYYLGYSNEALWPLFHCFQARVRIAPEQEACYRAVQTRFARAVLPMLDGDDLVWVHDYHLLLLGRELRRLGWKGRIGFFLHIPFPPHDLLELLPDPADTLRAMLDYDVVGFHVKSYLDNYVYSVRTELGARWDGTVLAAAGRVQTAGAWPVGIDPSDFAPRGDSRGVLRTVRGNYRMILGVERLDYTKGIPERILAFEQLLKMYPDWKRRVVLIQIASPSRTEVPAYRVQRELIESMLGRVNGEMGEPDWTPARYLYRLYNREYLAKLYRCADVGLVTPLRDGMNLVAKEYVAAQNPDTPGVLVLSRCAGAAEELPEALIVNPFVPGDVAEGIHRALTMSLEERRERHGLLMGRISAQTAQDWSRQFLDALENCHVERPAGEAELVTAARSGNPVIH